MKFNVTCPALPRHGKEYFHLPGCHGEGTVERTERWRSALSRERAMAAHPAIAARATRAYMRVDGRPVRHYSTGEHPVFRRDGMIFI